MNAETIGLKRSPMEQVRELVLGWAEEARQFGALRAELVVWLADRAELVSRLEGDELAGELLVLECRLVERVKALFERFASQEETIRQ